MPDMIRPLHYAKYFEIENHQLLLRVRIIHGEPVLCIETFMQPVGLVEIELNYRGEAAFTGLADACSCFAAQKLETIRRVAMDFLAERPQLRQFKPTPPQHWLLGAAARRNIQRQLAAGDTEQDIAAHYGLTLTGLRAALLLNAPPQQSNSPADPFAAMLH